MAKNNDALLVYRTWAENFYDLSDEDAGILIKTMLAYALEGEEPGDLPRDVKLCFNMAKGSIENAVKNRTNGGNGGRPPKDDKTETDGFENKKPMVSENEKPREEKRSKEKRSKVKRKHGEYAHVLLSDEELEKLNEEYGSSETEAAIKYLDEYIEMKGAKYRSHYLVMRKWVFDAVKENRTKSRGDPKDDLSEWAKEMERKLERGDTS